MKVIGVVGSLRKDGNTEFAIKAALQASSEMGAETEVILLSDYNISACDGCGKCKSEPCHIKDGMDSILTKIASTDAIILGTPVYYGSVAGGLKCFLDRCRPLKQQGNQLRGKIGGAIAVGKVWGHTSALDSILHFYGSQGVISVLINSNSGIGAQVFATERGDAEKDIDGYKAVKELGKRIVEQLLHQKRS